MVEPALTPALALDYLDELSTDIRGALLLDALGAVAASWHGDDDRAERMRPLVLELIEGADRAAGGKPGSASEIEVATGRGSVFAVRDRRFTLAVVAGRFVLSSLMLYDLRQVLADLGEKPA
ncbi:MAG: hypothetical protein E6G22_13280 [Actinobacteria bacterium]|nr:MAG: hypothetical protein E6G22_13280 [Actinomycetota bacterium]